MALESHLEKRRGKEEWKRCQENVIDVMKKTLGIFCTCFKMLLTCLRRYEENSMCTNMLNML
jgi:hypothetical protein